MFYEIFAFLLTTLVGVLVSACLLRVYLQAQRFSFANPLGQMVISLTDWLVRPVRQRVRASGRWDWVTLMLAYLLLLAQFILLALAARATHLLAIAPLQALFGLLAAALWLALIVLLVGVALSWLMPGHWLHELCMRLCLPLLDPVRRMLPATGAIDFAPLIASLVLYVLLMILRRIEAQLLMSALG
ncbi:hypothetical protein AAV94_10875 [Lampropedia cohaerens]|uniref:YggT family protein n=1 Tax=Lampropedia cohaerens TaxID=1610491 RepID=A0A0U1PXU3_9BURK|nr:YggT family protein [Lampropedia cohaerens]KKW67342.1 hypothetical protein AAV94_10875 [Lampropedia cohaerens]